MDLASLGHWLALPVLGFCVGALVGATGVGAGSLTTPMLVLGFGVHPLIAVGTDLLFATVTKSAGAIFHHKFGTVDTRVLRGLAIGSLPAAAATLGILSVAVADKDKLASFIKTGLGVMLLITVCALVLRPLLAPVKIVGHDGDGQQNIRTPRLVAIGAVLGSLVALTSIGAGALGVVALAVAAPAITTQRIVGTDIVHAIPLTLVCGLGHLAMGHLDVGVLAALLAGSIPGVWLGAQLGIRLGEEMLRTALCGVLLVAAYSLLIR
jgi:hypothetical protein